MPEPEWPATYVLIVPHTLDMSREPISAIKMICSQREKKVIENLKIQGFDVISIRPNPKIMKLLIKHDFFKWLNPVKATEFALWSST